MNCALAALLLVSNLVLPSAQAVPDLDYVQARGPVVLRVEGIDCPAEVILTVSRLGMGGTPYVGTVLFLTDCPIYAAVAPLHLGSGAVYRVYGSWNSGLSGDGWAQSRVYLGPYGDGTEIHIEGCVFCAFTSGSFTYQGSVSDMKVL
jgi:hypothetical protein